MRFDPGPDDDLVLVEEGVAVPRPVQMQVWVDAEVRDELRRMARDAGNKSVGDVIAALVGGPESGEWCNGPDAMAHVALGGRCVWCGAEVVP